MAPRYRAPPCYRRVGDRRGRRRRHRPRQRDGMARSTTSREPSAPFRFDIIAGGHSNLTYRVVAGDGVASCCAARRSATCSPAPTTWAASTASSPACRTARVPVPPALGLCDDPAVNGAPFYVMGYVDGHVVRDRHIAESAADARRPGHRQPIDRRHDGRDPRRRPRGRRARRPGPSRRLHRPPAEALVRPVEPAEDARAAARRRGPRRARRRWSPSRARRRSSTATTASTTRSCPPPATSSPCSTGRSARSAIRSPTSGCCRCTGPGPDDAASAWGGQSTTAPGFWDRAELAARYAEVSGRDICRTRLLRRVRLLEAGLHPRRRLRPLPRRRPRRARPGRAASRSAPRSTRRP